MSSLFDMQYIQPIFNFMPKLLPHLMRLSSKTSVIHRYPEMELCTLGSLIYPQTKKSRGSRLQTDVINNFYPCNVFTTSSNLYKTNLLFKVMLNKIALNFIYKETINMFVPPFILSFFFKN